MIIREIDKFSCMTWIFINYWISRMYEKGTFFTKRICLRTLEVDWRIQNYFIIKWLWFYNIFVCIASLRPPRITGPGGYQMVLAYQAGPTMPLLNRKNLLLNFYFDIIFLERRFKRTEERFPRYWRFQSTHALFLTIYFENNSPCFQFENLKCQTPYIGFIT